MADAATGLMTVAQFLRRDDGTDRYDELIDGRARATTPSEAAHAVIAANVGSALRAGLEPPGYAGMSAGVVWPGRDDLYLQADLLVSRMPLEPGATTIPEPMLIVEILSRATIEHDRGRKIEEHRRLESVCAIVLVSSERRYAEIWRRRGATWDIEEPIGDGALDLAALGVSIPCATIYAGSGVRATRSGAADG